jgi:hypothetical protein
MKKILPILGVCFLLIAMPAMTALPMDIVKNARTMKSNLLTVKKPLPTLEEPPEWANGNFTGVWGLNLLGVPLPPSGWIAGYYQEIGLGQFAAVFAEFNETNATGAILGIMLWVFFIGGVGSIATGNGTYVAGLGVANETHYYVRLNAIIGPSYYVHVEYTRFE